MRSLLRVAVLGLAVGLILDAGWLLWDAVTRPPVEGRGSSYVTGDEGLDRWAATLEAGGHEVRRQRRPFDLSPAPPGATVIVADASLDTEEIGALHDHVRLGGRLVLVGEEATGTASAILGRSVVATTFGGFVAVPAADVPEVAGVAEVETLGHAALVGAELGPLLTCGSEILAGQAGLGGGRLIVIADSSAVANGLIGVRDNARFAQAVVGPATTVVFAEHVHGFEQGSGLAGLPSRAKLALGLALVAGLLALLARREAGRVSEPAGSEASETARALARRLAELPGAAQLAQAEARGLLFATERLGDGVTDDEVLGAARDAGLDESTASVLVRPVTDRDLVALAAAITHLRVAAPTSHR